MRKVNTSTSLALFMAVISFIALVALWLSLMNYFNPPRSLVSFDVNKTVKLFTQQLAKQNLTPEQQKQAFQRFNTVLSEVEYRYCQQFNCALIVTPAAVNFIPDATLIIQQAIAKKMQLFNQSQAQSIDPQSSVNYFAVKGHEHDLNK
ncbi:TrbI F-type domain-containing protein [Fangia hongkongensis]|uniref:TrbI F-type domain-containing protein n=1 Tax=Fangia hongkongensis TaxID=270495 RepID=UPI00036E1686|nr:TrbI F-type domain-containing protein [Fangia hongkongensis]MBK2123763.1 TrbI F-type domain-containing protein [Fangia hongkongensis]